MNCKELTGIVITPNSPQYEDATLDYNLAIYKTPCIIVFCLNENDVINALKFAKKNNMNFRVRSGRHDFEGNSNVDNGLVIDMSKINYINVDKENNVVKVGGGCVLNDIYTTLVNQGYIIPAGTCPTTGLPGLSTVGGIGYLDRYYGLTIDNLVEATIIDSKFNKLTLNEKINSDLFWAIRGGTGSSFGVITSLTYKLIPAPDATYFTSIWPEDTFVQLLEIFQDIAPFTDNRLSLDLYVAKSQDNSVFIELDGLYVGGIQGLYKLIAPFFKVGTPTSFEISYTPFKDIIAKWYSDCYSANRFKNSGSYILNKISRDNLESIISLVRNAPEGYLHYLELLPLGGKIKDVPNNATAFAYRDALFISQIKSIWVCDNQARDSINWTKEFKRFLDTFSFGCYRGFTDFDIVNWQAQYFRNNYKRLQEVKDKYDRCNFFNFYQAVEPTYCNCCKADYGIDNFSCYYKCSKPLICQTCIEPSTFEGLLNTSSTNSNS